MHGRKKVPAQGLECKAKDVKGLGDSGLSSLA